MSERLALREKILEADKEVGNAIATLAYNICKYYNTEKPYVTIRQARSVYYVPSKKRVMFTFTANLVDILHECHHHISHTEERMTHKKLFVKELEADAFGCSEYDRWFDEYAKLVLPLQLKLVELRDSYNPL